MILIIFFRILFAICASFFCKLIFTLYGDRVDLQCVSFKGTAQWLSYTYIYVPTLFQIIFPNRLLYSIELLWYTAGPCWRCISFWWSVCSNLLPILWGDFCVLIVAFSEVFIYSRYKSVVQYVICKYFSSSCGLAFHSFNTLAIFKGRNFKFWCNLIYQFASSKDFTFDYVLKLFA